MGMEESRISSEQLICICGTLVNRLGSVESAKLCLDGWFGGIGKAYNFFVNKIGKWPWNPIIWKSCILLKHRIVLWLFAHGKLLTRDRQSYIADKHCVLCLNNVESAAHLFFDCPVSKLIWNNIRDWLGMEKLMGGRA